MVQKVKVSPSSWIKERNNFLKDTFKMVRSLNLEKPNLSIAGNGRIAWASWGGMKDVV